MNRWMIGTSHRALMAPETGAGASTDTSISSANGASGSSSSEAGANAAVSAAAATNGAAAANATNSTPAADAGATAAIPADASVSPAAPASGSLLEAAPSKKAADAATTDSTAKAADTPAPADAATTDGKTDVKPADKADAKADAKEPGKADDPAKAKDAKADDPAKATDPAKEATAAQPPATLSLEDLKLPEGTKLLDEPAKAFLETLNKADLAPKDRAQGLLDLHMKEVARMATEVAQQRDDHQRKVWNELNIERKNETRKEFGNTLQTRLSMAKAVIEEYGGTAEQKQALFDRLSEDKGTGMGNDVHLNRLLANIGKALNVFEDNMISATPRAPAVPRGMPGSGRTGWYEGANGAG